MIRRQPSRAASRAATRAAVWTGALVAASLPLAASAHVLGRAGGDALSIGFAHPFSGLDHQLAMLAVGLWAALRGGRAGLALPAAFVAGAALGLTLAPALAVSSAPIPALLAASVLALGACVAFGLPARGLAVPAALAFGALHGHAHVSDLAAAAAPGSFAIGFLAATALLHAVGFGAAAWLPRRVRPAWTRAGGGAIAAAGAVLVAVALH